MGQAMATLFSRCLGRDAARKPLLCDHSGDNQETGADSFQFGRYWKLFGAFIRRLLLGINDPPSDPPSLRYYGRRNYPTPTAPQHCIDIGVARDDVVGKLAPAPVEPPISRRSWGVLGPYSWEHKILLVGEGDFSFSASLAVAFGDASNMIATSLDSFEFLMQHYKKAVNNILELTSKNCKVMHRIDATKMANHPQLNSLKFDRIVYNFPHAGFSNLNAPKEDQILYSLY